MKVEQQVALMLVILKVTQLTIRFFRESVI